MMEGFKGSMLSSPDESIKISEKELAQINKKAYLDALQGFLKTAYQREMVRTFATEGILPYIPNDPKLKLMLESQANAISTKPPFMMLTVNPRAEVTYAQLNKAVCKFLRKKTILAYFYVYEVRTADTGLHCHILLQYNAKPYDFKRSGKNTFKNVCDSSNPACCNFKFLEEDKLPSKIEYLLGTKKDSKLKGVECSKLYREKNNIAAFVESSPPLPCRATLKPLIEFEEEPIIAETLRPSTPLGVECVT